MAKYLLCPKPDNNIPDILSIVNSKIEHFNTRVVYFKQILY